MATVLDKIFIEIYELMPKVVTDIIIKYVEGTIFIKNINKMEMEKVTSIFTIENEICMITNNIIFFDRISYKYIRNISVKSFKYLLFSTFDDKIYVSGCEKTFYFFDKYGYSYKLPYYLEKIGYIGYMEKYNNKLFVCTYDHIHIFKEDEEIFKWGITNTKSIYYEFYILLDEIILRNDDNELLFYTYSGKLIRTWKSKLGKIVLMTIHKNDILVVTFGTIYMVDKYGELYWKWSSNFEIKCITVIDEKLFITNEKDVTIFEFEY